jgi:hypothetical protein
MIRDNIGNMIQTGVLFEGTYGIEIEAESLKKHPILEFTFWDVKEDDSLRHFGKEYVLKAPVFYNMVPEALDEFATKTSKIKFLQDSISTSVHVHVNMLPEEWVTLANFLTIYMLTENLLIEYSGEYRRNNLFCLPIRSVPYVQKLCNQIFTYVQAKNYKFQRRLDEEQIKYAALNLSTLFRFGSIELRSFRGITDIPTIQSWIDIVQRMLEFSRQKITPPVIMDSYKDKGAEFLYEVFGHSWQYLNHPNRDDLLRTNLWYASTLAYSMNEDDWAKLDTPATKQEFSEKVLNTIAQRIFGCDFKKLGDIEDQKLVRAIAEDEAAAKKLVIKKDTDWMYETLEAYDPQPPMTPWMHAAIAANGGGGGIELSEPEETEF